MAQAPRGAPLFLRPASYRRRRRRDAARLLPVVGLFLIFLPILRTSPVTGVHKTAADGIYLFVIWAMLIVVAALISRAVNAPGDDDDPDPDTVGDHDQ